MVRYPPAVASDPTTKSDDLGRTATAPVSSTARLEPADAIGPSLGRYRLERELGEGGMGVVHAAFDPDLQRRIALKVLRVAASSTEAKDRLLREARAMARLAHPNVVTVYDVGTFQDQVIVGPGENTNIPGSLGINASVHSTTVQGRYKASYEIWWEMPVMATVFPNHVTIGRNVTIRVHAEDSSTHAAVAGTVKTGGVVIGNSDADIQHVFEVSNLQLTFSSPNSPDIQLQLSYVPGLLQVTTSPIIFNRPRVFRSNRSR
jgi:hypothetical protein